MVQTRVDSTDNIRRRYRHLFTLPARNRLIAYVSVLAVLTTLVTRLALQTPLGLLLFYLIATEAALIVTVEIDKLALERHNRVATFRRLASLAIISTGFWFILSLLGVLAFFITGSEVKLLSLVILGMFFAISFRALIMGALFYRRPIAAIPIAIVQPVILFFPTAFTTGSFTPSFFSSIDPAAGVIGGLIALLGIEIYMSAINNVMKIENFKPLDLLQAFLNAWAVEEAADLERFLDLVSKEGYVRSQMLALAPKSGGSKSALIIVPGVHPGPFYPIGSSNIPADIYSKLSSPEEAPMVVHSISDHELNLPSKKQVERYVATLREQRTLTESGDKMSLPSVRTVGKATISALAFGSTLFIAITQAPHGMEDFPVVVRREIESYASSKGFQSSLIIDTHNSEGEKPDEKECADAIDAAKQAIDELIRAEQYPFSVGVAHNSEVAPYIEKDVGPAGIGLVLFDIPAKRESFSVVIVDANNSLIGFREKVMEQFSKATSSRILEMCTSDTHVTAAKTSDAKGYLALGDVVAPEKFARVLIEMYGKAKARLAPAGSQTSVVTSHVKTIGSEVLESFSGILDSASSTGKLGAQVLGLIAIVITLVVALL